MESALYTKDDTGCYFDSARGIYIGQAVIEMAVEHGMKDDPCNCESCKANGIDSDCEFYHERWDEAEEFLNTLTSDDVYFGGNDNGDWGLWEIEEN